MTDHEYKQNAYYLIYLIRCVLNDKIPAQEKLDKMDLSQLYEVAQAHSLTSIAAFALESAGVEDEQFIQAKAKATRKAIYFNIEREAILAEFEKAGIWYLPLKGILLKDYYPKMTMREMADNDILFDSSRIEDLKAIMNGRGFYMDHDEIGHDLVFFKEPVFNFEMHTKLFDSSDDEANIRYYSDVKERLVKDSGNGFRYNFTNEDFYIYMLAHEYKHFSGGGTGLRSLVDTYVFLKHFEGELDFEYITAECEKLGLCEHEKQSRELALDLFGGKRLNDEESELLDYYIFSGTYGKTENSVKNGLDKRSGSKLRYVLHRLYMPMDVVEKAFPTFYKYPVLLPFLPAYRFYLGVKLRKNKIITELKTLVKL